MRWAIPVLMAAAVVMFGFQGSAAAERDDAPKHRRHAAHVMAAPSHQAMYMQLLAEKYAPETADAWKKTMAERVELMKAMHELKKSGKWKKEDAKSRLEKETGDRAAEMKEHMALVEQFTKAIESEDAAAIKSVLPKLLASEQKLNEALRSMLEGAGKGKAS